jgi:iron-sulfur cluster assembly accessory protein
MLSIAGPNRGSFSLSRPAAMSQKHFGSKERFVIIIFEESSMSTSSMSTTTSVPEVKKTNPVNLTPTAISKVKEIMAQQNPIPAGLRVGVVGGGCSGFSYTMQFENAPGAMDKVFEYDGLKVYIDATSLMYMQGATVDYIESLEGAGFKFDNPNVKSTCGCGSSFNA